MRIDPNLKPAALLPACDRLFELAQSKVRDIDRAWDPAQGTPVFTVNGKYTTRGWTEWTQGFQYGCPLLCFDATDDRQLLELGRTRTLERMAPHVTHMGVHDHGFNNISTYGNLRRLMREGRIEHNEWELRFYEMALKASGAVQAARWTDLDTTIDEGYIYSFNGRHSLFIDTMRTLRVLSLAHQLGHELMGEGDRQILLSKRMLAHAFTTDAYIICRGRPRSIPVGEPYSEYDTAGRTAHEGIFNVADGQFRCRSTQQGYSPFSTWTRGLAWAILGYAEQLEFVEKAMTADAITALDIYVDPYDPKWAAALEGNSHTLTKQIAVIRLGVAATMTADHYIKDVTALDGIPYWDDGAPHLHKLGDWRDRPAEPFNDHEPVDSSAAAIAAQGLIRLGNQLGKSKGKKYLAAGLTVARTLFAEPYLATKMNHQGLLLHSVYHRPNGWDHIPSGRKIPCGESSMWGDYHALELALLIKRMATGGPYLTFFDQ